MITSESLNNELKNKSVIIIFKNPKIFEEWKYYTFLDFGNPSMGEYEANVRKTETWILIQGENCIETLIQRYTDGKDVKFNSEIICPIELKRKILIRLSDIQMILYNDKE
jgi:hypothetical protein